jgi:hypothetical protein
MIPLSDVVFAFDMNRIESVGGVRYLWDYGPNGFHFAFPGGAADPTPQLDGSLSFDGGDYLSLPAGRLAEFYAKMPTRECTWLMRFIISPAAGASVLLFSCYSMPAANRFGQVVRAYQASSVGLYQEQNSASSQAAFIQNVPTGTGHSIVAGTIEATPRGIGNGASATSCVWGGGVFGTCVYDVAKAPLIGLDAAYAALPFTGRLSYLALLRGALSSPDMAQLSAMLAEGRKPFCQRAS